MGTDVLAILQERGFIAQLTDEDALRSELQRGPVVLYTGYDPTADSLHAGHLVTIMALMHFERAGHRPVFLLGGGTAKVGDPSGKTEMRQMLDDAQIAANIAGLRAQIGRFLQVGTTTQVFDNSAWLDKINYIEFLRDIGRHFSVNRMLSAESYKARLERGLSFIEFNYQILQAYDFLELQRRVGCRLQFGGDDQWGNILAGVELCRRVDQKLVFGATCPLLTTATGAKMGKTAHGAVWLDAAKLPPYEYYQYWVNTHDDDVVRLLALFTFLPMPSIRAVAQLDGAELNMAKSILAFEATAIAHGEAAGREAHAAAQGAFGGRALPENILPESQVPRGSAADAEAMPSTTLSPAALRDGLLLVDVLVQTGLVGSKNEARRLLTQGAVRLGDIRPQDAQVAVTEELFADGPVVVRAGKKRVHRLLLAER